MAGLEALLQAGWRADDHGEVVYLPLGDVDTYAWTSAPPSDLPRVMAEMEAKQRAHETLGLVLTFEDTNVGGNWIFFRDGCFVFSPEINLKRVGTCSDVSWYLTRILPALQASPFFRVGSWEWQEYT